MNACFEFRGRLADLLSGRAHEIAGELAWHEHLLSCAACRELIEAELALDELLASLPEPHLPEALTRRLLARLEPARLEPARAEAELDSLLDRSGIDPAPRELARNVLARLAGARRLEREDRALDQLLARLPEPAVPPGLASRVLAGLERERTVPSAMRISPVRAFPPRMRRIAIAAALLVGAGAGVWLAAVREGSDPVPGPVHPIPIASNGGTREPELANLVEAPPDELLASLDLLESWDLLVDAGVEADVNALGPLDELLLGLEMDGRAR